MTYNLQVTLHGRPLTKEQITKRYRLNLDDRLTPDIKSQLGLTPAAQYTWEDPPQHLIDRLWWRERELAPPDRARVTLSYQLDAGKERQWRSPA